MNVKILLTSCDANWVLIELVILQVLYAEQCQTESLEESASSLNEARRANAWSLQFLSSHQSKSR